MGIGGHPSSLATPGKLLRRSLKRPLVGFLNEKPLNTPAHYYLGLAWYHSGDAGKSLKHLEEARRINPSWKEMIDPYLEQLRGAGQPAGH